MFVFGALDLHKHDRDKIIHLMAVLSKWYWTNGSNSAHKVCLCHWEEYICSFRAAVLLLILTLRNIWNTVYFLYHCCGNNKNLPQGSIEFISSSPFPPFRNKAAVKMSPIINDTGFLWANQCNLNCHHVACFSCWRSHRFCQHTSCLTNWTVSPQKMQ